MKKVEQVSYLKLLPIALILLIVPLIVFMKQVTLDDTVVNFWTGSKEVIDFFAYYKSKWFIGLSLGALVFFIFTMVKKKIHIPLHKLYIPLGIYGLFVAISSVYSSYPNQAYYGFPDRYEGLFVILCYILICFITSILITSEFDLKYIVCFFAISVFLISVLGITQFFGFDFLQTTFGKEMMLPSSAHNLADSLKFNFPEHHIYSTLYNPNYVGTFFAMILPICVVFILKGNSIATKILGCLFFILAYINLLGSLSNTGYIGALVAILIVLVLLRKQLLSNIVPLSGTAISIIILTILMNMTSGGVIFDELRISKYLAPKHDTSTVSSVTDTKEDYSLVDLSIDKYKMTLSIANSKLIIQFNKDTEQLLFYDENNREVDISAETTDNKTTISFNNENYVHLNIVISGINIGIQAPNAVINAAIIPESGFKILSPAGKPTDIIVADSIGFEGKESWGSNRGYIWSRSLPLIKDTLLIGNGPDTFAMYFPQNDYIAKMKYLNGFYTVVDKPHNIYLQMAINTGVVSLVAFIVFVLWYIAWSLKLYLKPRAQSTFYFAGIGCFAAVLAYLVSGIGNDSSLSVSPVFWIILGIGIACNRITSNLIGSK